MSKIAEALAKAKERTGHTTAPFAVGGQISPVIAEEKKAAALRTARRRQRFWLVLSTGALILTMVVIWLRLAETDHDLAVGAKTLEVVVMPVESHEMTQVDSVAPSRVELINEVPVPLVLPQVKAGAPSAVEVATPRPELQVEVNSLVLTAVMPGERPRLMYKGRVVSVAERIEGELVFAGIHDGRLVFNDARGAIYLRRY